ncbi:MAG TPA: ABC transporter ATP-binding protein [Blastocatellia bacterium]|jgi:ATP-binding cassette subfamily B protein|nr:ABC transporter ATP-binding protein [Blastocatellia bacterium]
MPLIDPLPKPLEEKLAPVIESKDVAAVVFTDLDPSGRFGEEWLVLTPMRLSVYASNSHGFAPRVELNLEEIKKASADGLVGGGALLATVDGKSVEVLRYSNAQQRKFGRIAKYINDVKRYKTDLEKAQRGEKDADGKPVEAPKEHPRLEPDKEDQKRCPTCKLLLPEGSKVCPACMSKGKAIRRMMAYLKPHKRQILMIWAMMVVGLCFSLVPAYLTRPLTDQVLNPVKAPLPINERLSLLGWLVIILLGVQLFGQALGVWRGRMAVRLGQQISNALRNDVFRHLQSLSLRYFDKRQPGALISRVTNDTQSLQGVLVESIQNFFSNIFLFVGIGVVLLWMNWKLTLLVFIPAPLVLLLSKFFWDRMMNVWRRTWHLHSRLTATVSDSLAGVRVVRAFAKEDREVERFDRHSTELYNAAVAAEHMWVTFFPMLFFIMSVGNLIIWYIGGYQVIQDSTPGAQILPDRKVFTLGQFFTFIGYLGQFYGPLQFMSRVADFLSRSLASAERVFEVLDTESDVQDAENPTPLPRIEGSVEFKNVTFGYEPHKPVLKDVSFAVAPGEMIGLVGQSGAGKSTTINLICRFYEAQEGEVSVDGVNINRVAQKDLRSQIGVVLQEPFLFSGSIYENIAFARPGATREDVMAAAKAANAHDFIIQKPDGYDTQVGERGQTLSGGERQRVSIARAILHDPRILILDEATSSVDTDTEKKIQDAIARLIKGRTTFAIAHRLSTLRNATRLVVLNDGKVVEIGGHEELLEKKGEFYRLVQMQQEMNKIIEVK